MTLYLDGIEYQEVLKSANYAKWAMGRSQVGSIFFVDGASGSDNNPGLTPLLPKQKIETMLDSCTNGKHDYIFVTDYWTADDMPITVSKTTVHIIGVSNLLYAPMSMAWTAMPGGAAANFELTAASHYSEIAGFQMAGDSSHPGLVCSAGCVGVWVHHNSLGSQIVTQDGILLTADMADGMIENNYFGKALTQDGIRIAVDATETIIRNNLFMRCPGIGINTLSGGGHPAWMMILDNRFILPSDDHGKAITLTDAEYCYIDGNRANFGRNDAMTNNPYVDGSGDDSNTWGLNWKGGASAYPA
jgi:hypothetical protein